MNIIHFQSVLKKGLVGVAITSAATSIITMKMMKKKTENSIINGVVYCGFYNTVFFEKGGKKLLVKALEQEGFYNVKIIYQDDDCMKISCRTDNLHASSVFMVIE